MTLRCVLIALAVLFLFSRYSRSQNKGNVTFPNTFLANPGARALALGGAITGLADDASAAELNPAGITQIPRDEISLEYRQQRHVYDERFRFATQNGPTDIPGNLPCQDVLGLENTSSSRCGSVGSSLSHSFAFGSITLHSRAGFSFGFYRHEIDNENAAFTASTLIVGGGGPVYTESGGSFSFQRRIERTGIAVAYKVSNMLSLGVSASENSLSYSSTQTFVWSSGLGGPLDGLSLGRVLQSGNETKFGFTGGILVTPSPLFQVGASFSSKSQFKIAETDLGCSHCSPTASPGESVFTISSVSNTFTLPEKFSLGIAVRPSRFNIVAEVDRLLYSEDTTSSPQTWSATRMISASGAPDDIWELRGGVEWLPLVSPSGSALAVRAGFYREPDHVARLSCSESNPTSGEKLGNCANIDPAMDAGLGIALAAYYRDLAPPKETTNHVSVGLGVVWAWGQVDLGYDRASNLHQDTFSATLVIRP